MNDQDLIRTLQSRLEPLMNKYRARCLWFLTPDYLPDTPESALRVLEYIERYGDRQAYLEAEELKKWLSQNYSAPSAAS
jgi:hypothetical protein